MNLAVNHDRIVVSQPVTCIQYTSSVLSRPHVVTESLQLRSWLQWENNGCNWVNLIKPIQKPQPKSTYNHVIRLYSINQVTSQVIKKWWKQTDARQYLCCNTHVLEKSLMGGPELGPHSLQHTVLSTEKFRSDFKSFLSQYPLKHKQSIENSIQMHSVSQESKRVGLYTHRGLEF